MDYIFADFLLSFIKPANTWLSLPYWKYCAGVEVESIVRMKFELIPNQMHNILSAKGVGLVSEFI